MEREWWGGGEGLTTIDMIRYIKLIARVGVQLHVHVLMFWRSWCPDSTFESHFDVVEFPLLTSRPHFRAPLLFAQHNGVGPSLSFDSISTWSRSSNNWTTASCLCIAAQDNGVLFLKIFRSLGVMSLYI